MNKNKFKHWSEIKYLKDIVTNPLIEVGDYSYYSGYYDNYSFEDGCVRYLWGDKKSRSLFNPIEEFGWQIDRLIIGNYVCIAGGVVILMGEITITMQSGLLFIRLLNKLAIPLNQKGTQS